MALGLAQMFGIRLPENFDRPYAVALDHRVLAALAHVAVALVPRLPVHPARRQPRIGARRRIGTCIIVFLVTGLWHGANWTFVVWGAYHGMLLLHRAGARASGGATRTRAAGAVGQARDGRASCSLGWILFRSPTIGRRARVPAAPCSGPAWHLPLDARSWRSIRWPILALVIGAASVLLPRVVGHRRPSRARPTAVRRSRAARSRRSPLRAARCARVRGRPATFSPFLYFQF